DPRSTLGTLLPYAHLVPNSTCPLNIHSDHTIYPQSVTVAAIGEQQQYAHLRMLVHTDVRAQGFVFMQDMETNTRGVYFLSRKLQLDLPRLQEMDRVRNHAMDR